ncbi:MAG: pyruvate kinase [Chloroflexota bacterium]|nr:pyruvate kinase [Chloroflexota bacterium]
MPLTKIVCTLGPATDSPEIIRALIHAGMTVARLNFSHGTHANKRRMVSLIRRVADEEGRYVAVMGDLQGPKIRVGNLPEEGVELRVGEIVTLTAGEVQSPTKEIPFPHPEIIPDLHLEDRILLDDGSLELEISAIAPPEIRCRVRVGGVLTSHKGVNLPGADLQIPTLTEKDYQDAELALELQLDYLALSFVRRASDVGQLRAFLMKLAQAEKQVRRPGENPHHWPALVAKIEKPEALLDLPGIVQASDAVMVARGDLGVEIAPEQVPLAQKRIIRLCNQLGRPVITATQMLQSMIENPRPTRAEASDVANAILDGSDAVMLSGETSVGRFPVEAVQMMAKIAQTVEGSTEFPYNQLLKITTQDEPTDPQSMRNLISRAIGRGTVKIAEECQSTAILTSTESGRTARLVARHRPRCPLVAATPFKETACRLQLIWGVTPVLVAPFDDTDQMIQSLVQSAVACGFADVGSNVVLTAGIPFEVHGVTNMLKVHTVREADLGEK